MASELPAEAPILLRCPVCGTGYTALGWGWLDWIGVQRGDAGDPTYDLRRCAVAMCLNTLGRPSAPEEPSDG